MANHLHNGSSDSERKARWLAALLTTVIVVAAAALMACTYLSVTKYGIVVSDKQDIVLVAEEFIDVVDMPAAPDMDGQHDSRAQADEQLESQPTPISGTDVDDQGNAGDPPPVTTAKQESSVKQKKPKAEEKPKPNGPAVDKKKKEEEAIKRKAENEVANAFNKSQGKHNNSAGAADKGNNGVSDGKAPQGTLTGHGTGKAGGGWAIPKYGSVRSTVTGSVKMVVTIDRTGAVTSLRFDGGDPPAATNAAARNACAAEVRARRFTRSNPDDAPESATAYITYTFK